MKQRKTASRVAARPALPPPGGEVIVYSAPDGTTALEVRLDADTVWLSLNQMARLFGRDKSVISRHLSNVFKTRELDRKAVVACFATTGPDGKTYQVDYFSLDAILSVGYRVNSKRGTYGGVISARIARLSSSSGQRSGLSWM